MAHGALRWFMVSLFRLFGLLLLAATIAPAAAPFRLWEIATSKFVERAPGQLWVERGLLSALGEFRKVDELPVLSTVHVPVEARDKVLISLEAWLAYDRLGTEAAANFVADPEGERWTLGMREYIEVHASPIAKLDVGNVLNLSTRGYASLSNKLIGGFVIEKQPRWVLIRAVGPGLTPHGVADALADPYLTLFEGQIPLYHNDSWHQRPEKDDIRAAAVAVGAFPLGETSTDAALLVELPPGLYSAHVEPGTGSPGTALLEIYILP